MYRVLPKVGTRRKQWLIINQLGGAVGEFTGTEKQATAEAQRLWDTTVTPRARLEFVRDEYMRDMLRGLKPGQKFCVPTPWGYYALELDAAGALTVYMATDSGPTRRVFVAPECSNVVTIIPAEA